MRIALLSSRSRLSKEKQQILEQYSSRLKEAGYNVFWVGRGNKEKDYPLGFDKFSVCFWTLFDVSEVHIFYDSRSDDFWKINLGILISLVKIDQTLGFRSMSHKKVVIINPDDVKKVIENERVGAASKMNAQILIALAEKTKNAG